MIQLALSVAAHATADRPATCHHRYHQHVRSPESRRQIRIFRPVSFSRDIPGNRLRTANPMALFFLPIGIGQLLTTQPIPT
jgi:hypothetical protein